MVASQNHEDGSNLSGAGNEEKSAANNSETQKNITVSPVIDAEGMNAALLAANDPREALRRIRSIADEMRQELRNCTAGKSDLTAGLNRIVLLTGGAA